MAADKSITVHQGVEIFLSDDGKFYAILREDPRDEHSGVVRKSTTLAALKKAIDDFQRARARLALAAIVVVARVGSHSSYWTDDDAAADKNVPTWIRGTFLGINAHTGKLKIKLLEKVRVSDYTNYKVGDTMEIDSGTVLFRDGDPNIDVVKQRDAEYHKAGKAKRAAERAMNTALKDFGTSPELHRRRGNDSRVEAAATVEAELVELLGGPAA